MSGGSWDYSYLKIRDIAEALADGRTAITKRTNRSEPCRT